MDKNFFSDARMGVVVACVMIAVLTGGHAGASEAMKAHEQMSLDQMKEEQAYSIGVQAYVWGYPLVSIFNRCNEAAQAAQICVLNDAIPRAPLNYMSFLTNYTNPKETIIVSPNVDTVYGAAWLDLRNEPVVLQIPDPKGRYWMAQLCDAYTNVVACPGSRVKSKPGYYLIVGPDWKEAPPKGMVDVFRSPTNTAFVLVRFLMKGQSDRPNVLPLINETALFPLSRYGNAPVKIDYTKTPRLNIPPQTPDWVPDETFWEKLREAMQENPPRKDEEALVALFKQTGLGTSGDPAVARGLARAVVTGKEIVSRASNFGNLGKTFKHGWTAVADGGRFGDDYITRAGVAKSVIFLNYPEDAIYYQQTYDEQGTLLDGQNQYVLHFDKKDLPPVRGFWSVTMYNEDHFLVENPIHRYNIGTVTEGLKYNADGSLDIHIQHDQPSPDRLSNWLPAPKLPFVLILRAYIPDPPVLSGEYNPPPVKRLK